MIYTSYFGQMKNLIKNGIEPIAISRGVPKNYQGARRTDLAPTWAMLKMSDEEYDRCYDRILSRIDVKEFIAEYEGRDVALLCWEKDINDCHRKKVAEWLQKAGCEVKEFGTEPEPKAPTKAKKVDPGIIAQQISMFSLF